MSLRFLACLALLAAVPGGVSAQACPQARTVRLGALAGLFAATEGAAIAAFHDDWWDTPRRDFRVIWGRSASRGQDALAHGLLAYHTAGAAAAALRWACVESSSVSWLAAGAALLAQLPKEFGDGFHTGFSATDMSWVLAGGLFQAARQTWSPARTVSVKWNYWPSEEHSSGAPSAPGVLTDWAGHRFYLAFHPGSQPGGTLGWPAWLGVAVGHGVAHWVTRPPERDWYLVLDIGFQGIPLAAPWWRRAAALLDLVHVPAPGVRVRNGSIALGLF